MKGYGRGLFKQAMSNKRKAGKQVAYRSRSKHLLVNTVASYHGCVASNQSDCVSEVA